MIIATSVIRSLLLRPPVVSMSIIAYTGFKDKRADYLCAMQRLMLFHILLFFFFIGCTPEKTATQQGTVSIVQGSVEETAKVPSYDELIQSRKFKHLLDGKRVGLVVNQTSMIGTEHLVDHLITDSIEVVKVFAPEHGFRGHASAGEKIDDQKDPKTGLPIFSLYGSNKKPNSDHMAGLDIILFDIQDVGARFYTYISTMHYVMEAAAENNVEVVILDRPNPNGFYVAGPVRQEGFESFVGMHPIPVVHGLTVCELAEMIQSEGWLAGGIQCKLNTIKMDGYHHAQVYDLPVKPSPNLPNQRSILMYPSLCLFEGTTISAGRGTDFPFQVYGSPALSGDFTFTPEANEGAKYPKHEGLVCNGKSFQSLSLEELKSVGFDLRYLHDAYTNYEMDDFVLKNNFLDKLAGTDRVRKMLLAGKTVAEIEQTWESDLAEFKRLRKQYLLYPDFE